MGLNLQEQRQILLRTKNELGERLEDLRQREQTSMAASIGELSSYDNHPADLGSEMFERGKDLALHNQLQSHLIEVELALEKIDAGTYGNCLECGQAIPEERLRALPAANLCLKCQDQAEQVETGARPPERRPRTKGAEVDREDIWQAVARFGEHAPEAGAGAYYGDLNLDEPRGGVEDVEKIPTYKDAGGVFYEDNRG